MIGDIVDLTSYVEESISSTYRSLIDDGSGGDNTENPSATSLVFSCAGCTMSDAIENANCAQIASPAGDACSGHDYAGSPSRGAAAASSSSSPDAPVPRNVTMEEPYFSDELAAQDVEKLKKSVNSMMLGGEDDVGGVAKEAVGPGKISKTLTAETEDTEEEEAEEEEEEEQAVGPSEAECATDPEPPEHERWAVSDPAVDLSGDWEIIASDEFRKEYSKYLQHLGFGRVLRNVALSVIGYTTEETRQTEEGRTLRVRGKNPRGVWERALVASGFPDFATHSDLRESVHYEHRKVAVLTADNEEVEAEAWWERGGTVHRSWLRGGKKYGGGDFESHRYLEDGGNVLVCESIFHPDDKSKPRASVTWRFRRVGAER